MYVPLQSFLKFKMIPNLKKSQEQYSHWYIDFNILALGSYLPTTQNACLLFAHVRNVGCVLAQRLEPVATNELKFRKWEANRQHPFTFSNPGRRFNCINSRSPIIGTGSQDKIFLLRLCRTCCCQKGVIRP